MKQLLVRLSGSTPVFFKRMQILGGSIGTLCLAIQVIPHISARLSELSVNGVVAGTVITLVAQFACTNTPEKPTI